MSGKKIVAIICLLLGVLVYEDGYCEMQTIKIRLPWLHQSQYAGVYVAKEKGFFEKRGLKCVLEK